MKLYQYILLSSAALIGMTGFSSCKEENTLEGANVVYIEMDPTSYNLCLGDTIPVNAHVSNESGNTINTPIEWSVDDESIAQLVTDSLGTNYLVAVNGGQNKTTKLRATLPNGKFGVAEVMVFPNNPQQIAVLDSVILERGYKASYNIGHDSVVFTVTPKELLLDYEPTYTLDGLESFEPNPFYVDREKGTVAVHYSAPRKYGEGSVSVTIGDEGSGQTGSIAVKMIPDIEGATFYGPDYADRHYIGARPSAHLLAMYYAKEYERVMDINKLDTCRVAINLSSAQDVDALEAYNVCGWEPVEGSSVLVSAMYNEVEPDCGFNAVLVVRSGIVEGETTFRYTTPKDTLTAVFSVYNYKESYPVDEVLCDHESIEMASGETVLITTATVPMSSYGFHKPKPTVADPEIVQCGEYISDQIPVIGLKEGETTITLTSNGKTLTIPVKVKEAVKDILWGTESGNNNQSLIFTNQEVTWDFRVITPSGDPNPYPVSFTSSADSVAMMTPVEGDLTKGILKGINPGTAAINAKVLNILSNAVTVTVIKAPATGNVPEFSEAGIYFDGTDIVIDCTPEDQKVYQQIVFNLAGASALEGTFSPAEGSTVEINHAIATITGGSLTITRKDDSTMTLDGTVEMEIPGNGTITWTFNHRDIEEW